MSKYSKGPWEVGGSGNQIIYCNDDIKSAIADCHYTGKKLSLSERKANALVMSKAFTMLELLKEYRKQAYEGKDSWSYGDFLSRLEMLIKEIEGE